MGCGRSRKRGVKRGGGRRRRRKGREGDRRNYIK